MAASAYLVANVLVRADGKEYQLGTGDLPVTVALTSPGGIDQRQWDIANGATVTFWSSAAPTTGFKAMALLSTVDLMIELQGATVADNHHFKLSANKPFMLFSDDTLLYNAASFTGASDDFRSGLAKNSSGGAGILRTLICE